EVGRVCGLIEQSAGAAELGRPAAREVRERHLARFHLLHERRLRRIDLPDARLIEVDAGVPDLHRVGRALERAGASGKRGYDKNGTESQRPESTGNLSHGVSFARGDSPSPSAGVNSKVDPA